MHIHNKQYKIASECGKELVGTTSYNFIAGQMNLDMIMEAENNLKKVLKEAKESQATASNNDECQDFIKNIMEGKSMMCMKKYRDSVI